MSWKKEKKEHPWATKKQAKRIASDHAKQKHKPHHPQKSHNKVTTATQTASQDFTSLYNGSITIANQRKP
jgi:hypothetical protein